MLLWLSSSALAGAPAACPVPDPPGVEVCPGEGVSSRLVLVGDAGVGDLWPGGDPSPCGRDPVLALTGQCAAEVPSTAVVFLGDNVYGGRTLSAQLGALFTGRVSYGGIPRCPGDAEGCDKTGVLQLEDQLDVSVEAGVPVRVVPGNHDWYRGPRGLHREREQIEAYAERHAVDVRFVPPWTGAGRYLHCGVRDGIVAVERFGGQSLVAFDSMLAFACSDDDRAALGAVLWARVATELERGQHVIVAAHHPAVSHGNHHDKARIAQDMRHPAYLRYLEQVLAAAPEGLDASRVVLASGHEHHLEIVRVDIPGVPAALQIVSGAGTISMAGGDDWHGCDPGPVAAALSPGAGFVVVDLLDDGSWQSTLVDLTSGTCRVPLDGADRGVCRPRETRVSPQEGRPGGPAGYTCRERTER